MEFLLIQVMTDLRSVIQKEILVLIKIMQIKLILAKFNNAFLQEIWRKNYHLKILSF